MEQNNHDAPLDVADGVIDYLKGELEKLQAKCDRYEAALKGVRQMAKAGIFPHLPVETMGAQKCIEIDAVLNEALCAVEGKEVESDQKCRCLQPAWNAFTGRCLTCGNQ